MFIDRAEIYVRGGNGGNGCMSFRRERFIPKGGPDGGDGGRGGSVYLVADESVATLLDMAGRHHWTAENGKPGKGKDMTGRSGRDLIVRLPPGTLVYDRDNGRLLKDLDAPGKKVRIVRGGRGGRGNAYFATSRHQAPRYAQTGEEGQERWLRLELKLIADVGLVGLPNAGKSTLLSRLTKARPKIAAYPFTTLEPQLGIVEMPGYQRFVMADIPGLIEGAHEGHGLGDDFLRHIERTRIILHLIDVHPLPGQATPIEAYRIIRNELQKYSPALANKPELIVANKIDLAENNDAVNALRDELETVGIAGDKVLAISGVTGSGLERLGYRLWEMVEAAKAREQAAAAALAAEAKEDPFRAILPDGHEPDEADLEEFLAAGEETCEAVENDREDNPTAHDWTGGAS
ncbi:MAG: GTPase ObgE [Phycisphaerae bacterium]|nr:GTPase ObgE [Phycisphaerae bacterium]